MKHILLVEDDLSLLNGLSFAIKKQGYALDIAHTRQYGAIRAVGMDDRKLFRMIAAEGATYSNSLQNGRKT